MRRTKIFINDKKARRVRKEIRARKKFDHPQEAPENIHAENKTPGWAKAFWDDLSKSPPDFVVSFRKSIE